jgi:protein-L-isoaspartate(D-aspartate) O-methyltransferase
MKIIVCITLCLIFVACAGENTITPRETSTAHPDQSDIAIVETKMDDPYLEKRLEMVDVDIEARGIANPDVLRAMQSVPRHEFVPAEYLDLAYSDRPLPIGYGQTISQPYIVAWMTELLKLSAGDKVLEIGTGSGYQAAVLATLGYVDVYSIEIVPELAENARNRLSALGYDSILLLQGDGYYGWEEYQPFDAIIVTAAPDHLPQPLVNQLAEGGRMVIPIGPQGGIQTLWVFEKIGTELSARNMGFVTFVPFTGGGVDNGDLVP